MPIFEKAPRQFYIAPQNGQRVFFAGYNAISGVVVLDLVEPKKTRGVFIHLIGRVKTCWKETESYTDHNNETKYRDVIRADSAEIVHLSTPVWLPQNGLEEDFLPPGQYSLPFNLTVPPSMNLPPNFQTDYGKISYVLKANIDRPWRYDHRCFLPISLLPVVDCNEPRYSAELQRQDEKTMCCCCCASGPILATARIPVSAWCPGEFAPCLVTLENHTKSDMENISFALDCETTYHAGYHSKSDSKRVGVVKLGRKIPAQGEIREVMYLRVPSCCPSFSRTNARLISHEYWFHVTIHLPAGSFNMHLRMPTVIGTIPHMYPPLFAEQRTQQQAPMYSWASVEGITKAAASVAGPANASAPSTYEDAYTESADPDDAYSTGQMQYVYFEMPQTAMPGMPVGVSSTGNERTPLIGASAPVAGEPVGVATTTTTTTSSVSVGAAPASMFAAPCGYTEIPKDQ